MTTFSGPASEDAAVFGYSLVLAHADPSIIAPARRRLTDHRTRADGARALWPDAPPAPVGYASTLPVTDPAQALALAVRLESDCCAGWRVQIAESGDPTQRRFAIDSLTASAVQLAKWRTLVPEAPFEAFPGFPVDF